MGSWIKSGVFAAAALMAGWAGTAQAETYRVNANSTDTISLNICNPQVRVTVDGDNDTDLDFWVYDSNGNLVHQDTDTTDITFFTVSGGGGCRNYSLRVQNLGSVYNQYTVTMVNQGGGNAVSQGNSGDGRNRQMTIRNYTGETIMILRWSNSGAGSWGPDRLGSSQTIAAGSQVTMNVDDGSGACNFDFRAETSSSRNIERRGINVCSESYVTFN